MIVGVLPVSVCRVSTMALLDSLWNFRAGTRGWDCTTRPWYLSPWYGVWGTLRGFSTPAGGLVMLSNWEV